MAPERLAKVVLFGWAVLLAGTAPGITVPDALSAPAGRAPAAQRQPASAALPDTVLAVIGPGRRVTLSGFQHAWRQVEPPARPDSLTPESARQFLDLLVDKEALAEAAAARGYRLNPRDSSEWLALRDRLALQAVLDSAMEAAAAPLRARGEPVPGREGLGVAARDSAMVRIGATFDRAALERALEAWQALPRPSPDSGLMSQLRILGTMPVVAGADTARVLARSVDGDYRIADLVAAWKRLNPMYRPRIETLDGMQDLVENGLFERHLRAIAERRRTAERPAIRAELERNREFKHVGYLVNAEVYEKIPYDSLTLRAFFTRTEDDYALPLRIRVVRLTLASEAEARASRARLAGRAEAETLAAIARRSGLDYAGEITAVSDSALFAAALAAGTEAVVGPIAVREGWQIARVMEVIPARRRRFEEAFPFVRHRWEQEQSEERMRALIARSRAATRVTLNERALARLGAGGVAP